MSDAPTCDMKRILVALDGSSRAPVVLASAARLARSCEAKLVLLRVVGLPVELTHQILDITSAELEDMLQRNARTELERLAGSVDPSLIERSVVVIGTPWDSIVREAREVDADVVAIGSHGYSGIDRVLGTTAAKVVNHSDRNVLVVRTAL